MGNKRSSEIGEPSARQNAKALHDVRRRIEHHPRQILHLITADVADRLAVARQGHVVDRHVSAITPKERSPDSVAGALLNFSAVVLRSTYDDVKKAIPCDVVRFDGANTSSAAGASVEGLPIVDRVSCSRRVRQKINAAIVAL